MGQKKQSILISSSSIPGDDMSQNWRGYGLSDSYLRSCFSELLTLQNNQRFRYTQGGL